MSEEEDEKNKKIIFAHFVHLLEQSQISSHRSRQSVDTCGFCSKAEDLTICQDCGCIAYCSSEHQKFDWKKHKPICKTIQSKILAELELQGSLSLPVISSQLEITTRAEKNDYESAGILRPIPIRPNESKNAPSTSSQQAVVLPNITPVASPTPNSTEVKTEITEQEEILIDTDDPDIQIIEGPSMSSTQRSRKRTIQPKALKDHTLNMAYSITPEEHKHYLMQQGRTFNQHQSVELRLSYIAEHILKSLTEYGWAVVDNFLGNEHCHNIHREIRTLENRGLFTAGQVADAKNKDEQHLKDIRSDKTYWYDGTDEKSVDAVTIRMLVVYLDSIVHRFARRLNGNQIQGRSKPMLAIYPSNGSRYVKHVDNPSKDGRRITVIYYCNPKWDYKIDGGVLRLYPETSAVPLDIEPRADRLIAFWSDHRIPHEVMPVYKDRLAITVWYMDKSERDRHHGKADNKSVSSNDPSCSTDVAPKVKDSRLDTTILMQRAKIDDSAERDEGDSGRGASVHNTISSSTTRAHSRLSRNNSRDSANLSDDEDRLPISDDLQPEFNI